QTLPVQGPTRTRLVAPSGINPSGTLELPPPRSRPPQAMARMTVSLPSSTEPQLPLPATVVTSSSSVPGGSVVLVVGVVEVVVVDRAPVVVVVEEAMPRLASEQSGIDGASALTARNDPAWSRRIGPAPHRPQLP